MEKKKLNIYSIEEGEGLGDLKFGLNRSEVALILGKPDEKEKHSYSEDDEDLSEIWHFDELELSLGFDQDDDWRLVTLAITSKDYKFGDYSPIGLSMEQLKNKLNEKGIKDFEFEDWASLESPSHELLSSDELGMNFWFDEGFLTDVQWGPLFIDDDTIKWPEKK